MLATGASFKGSQWWWALAWRAPRASGTLAWPGTCTVQFDSTMARISGL